MRIDIVDMRKVGFESMPRLDRHPKPVLSGMARRTVMLTYWSSVRVIGSSTLNSRARHASRSGGFGTNFMLPKWVSLLSITTPESDI